MLVRDAVEPAGARSEFESESERIAIAPVVAAIVIIVGTAAAIYHPVAGYDFLNFDDRLYILDNEAIANGLSVETIVRAFTEVFHGNWQPMAILAHAYDVTLFGFEPGWHHLSSVAWHVLNSVLLYFLTLRLVKSWAAAMCASVLFLVHPQHMEPVVWISSRQHLVGATFFLLCLLAYTRYVRTKGRWEYAGMVTSFAAAVLAKSMMITTPFVLLLLDLWPLGRFRDGASTRRAVLDKLPLFGICLLYGVALYTREVDQGMIHSVDEVTLGARLDNVLVAYSMYLQSIVSVDALSIHYPDTMGDTPGTTLALIAALLGGISAGAALTVRKFPMIFVSWFWFAGMLFPVSGIVSYHYHCMADRYAYVPHMGIAIGVAALGHRLLRSRPAAIAGLALAMGFAAYFASVSTDRLPRFRNDARLFAEAIERYPVNPFATICLAYEYSGNGYYLEAVSMFQRTLEVSKWQSLRNDANQIIALNYDHLDAPALAYPHYREVLQERPEDEMLPGRTKNAFDAMQAHAKEIETLEAQLRENDSAPIEDLERLAQLYALNGRTNESIELYERAAELGLAGNEVSEGIIDALTLGGRPHEALALARDAYAQTPEHAEVAYLYIRALLRAREIAEARSALAMSAERFPAHAGMSRLHRLLAD